MATRTQDLTEFSKPIADEMAARCGSLKHVLSAGVIALKAASPGMREIYMARATGKDVALEDEENRIARMIIQILRTTESYGLPPEDLAYLAEVRQTLSGNIASGPDKEVPQRKRAKRA